MSANSDVEARRRTPATTPGETGHRQAVQRRSRRQQATPRAEATCWGVIPADAARQHEQDVVQAQPVPA